MASRRVPDNLSLIPVSDTAEKERTDFYKLSFYFHRFTVVYTHARTHVHTHARTHTDSVYTHSGFGDGRRGSHVAQASPELTDDGVTVNS